jgi:hypothetical protein
MTIDDDNNKPVWPMWLWATSSSLEVDSRLLINWLSLRDFFWKLTNCRQSLDFFFLNRQLVYFQKNVNWCNFSDWPRSRLLTSTEFFEDFEAILYEFFHFPLKSDWKILHMRIFTRQRRELNDDCCDINIIIILWQLMRCYIRILFAS